MARFRLNEAQEEIICKLTEQSRFVFKGTVRTLKAATWNAVRATEDTVVVHVDEVLYAPKTLPNLVDKDVTVRTKNLGKVKVGQEAVFFTDSWLYGEGIAVREVGRISTTDLAFMRRRIADCVQRIATSELQRRIAQAELIVAGKVLDISPAPRLPRRGPLTSHDPDLWTANIGIESVEKGQSSTKAISILFPNNYDPMWAMSPKFRKGQEGIWLLQKGPKEKGVFYQIPGYKALYPSDFQAKDQLPRIRELVKRGR